MSLRGRYVIDRIKRLVSHRFALPCPPYGDPAYWEGAYKKLGPDDVYEWGSVTLEQLREHSYDANLYADEVAKYGFDRQRQGVVVGHDGESSSSDATSEPSGRVETTFGESIVVHPNDAGKKVLLLGCGNSKLGEEMIDDGGWSARIIQADVSQRVVSTMTERCSRHVSEGTMDFVQDDATSLTAFEDGTIDACVDKGLVDALFCATRPDQLGDVMKSVNRVLVPGGVFAFFSFSRPEFLLGQVMGNDGRVRRRMWEDAQVRALDTILMYRFVKGEEVEDEADRAKRQRQRRLQRRRQ